MVRSSNKGIGAKFRAQMPTEVIWFHHLSNRSWDAIAGGHDIAHSGVCHICSTAAVECVICERALHDKCAWPSSDAEVADVQGILDMKLVELGGPDFKDQCDNIHEFLMVQYYADHLCAWCYYSCGIVHRGPIP